MAKAKLMRDAPATLKKYSAEITADYHARSALSSDAKIIEGKCLIELKSTGDVEGAVQPFEGTPFCIWGTTRRPQESDDLQVVSPIARRLFDDTSQATLAAEQTTTALLKRLRNLQSNSAANLLSLIELAQFEDDQIPVLLPLLWDFILINRNSNNRSTLVGVASAIRKYVAIMPMTQMGELAILLDPANRSPLPIELEIEVAKMVYRNYETHPPEVADPQPTLASRLLDLAREYTGPRVLLRENYSAAAALAIGAIVAMRSTLAEEALQIAAACPHVWFSELIEDDLAVLQERWNGKSEECASWLAGLRSRAFANR